PLADDLIAGATVAVITEDVNYPQEKLQNIPMADTARATEAAGNIVQVRITLTGAKNPKAWFFLNHNILSEDWTIYSCDGPGFWGVPIQSQTVTYRRYDTKFYGTEWLAPSQWFVVEFPAICTYPAGEKWEMGKILCGTDITEFSKGFSPGIERGLGFDNIHNETEFGVMWSYIKRARIQYLGMSWDPHLRVPLLAELEDFIETTYG
ncbi:unnamed protein product, partial [marine sediment metagenome]